MRSETNRETLEGFMATLGREIRGSGSVFLTGGGTAVWEGWRAMTVDINVKASPEPPGFFRALARLKEELAVNIELASPDQFIPELPGWRERSIFLMRSGGIDYFHYDPYAQALAKLERNHARDRVDVFAMLERGLIEKSKVWELFLKIEGMLERFPAIEAVEFRQRVWEFCRSEEGAR